MPGFELNLKRFGTDTWPKEEKFGEFNILTRAVSKALLFDNKHAQREQATAVSNTT